ncbi:hypothetical protein [Streptomyces sp. NPDC048248]|uniref:hypothetical protein n=1 Tax=Streptomyces sp. NPDC048248 TaxID=3365523 RepID=UPI003718D041
MAVLDAVLEGGAVPVPGAASEGETLPVDPGVGDVEEPGSVGTGDGNRSGDGLGVTAGPTGADDPGRSATAATPPPKARHATVTSAPMRRRRARRPRAAIRLTGAVTA